MKAFFYRTLTALANRLGNWVFLMIAWFVATGYFIFFPRRVRASVRFYRRLFAERGRCHALLSTWRQYHAFVHVFLDRHRLSQGDGIRTTFSGWEHIVAAVDSGRGGIILMSHVGNWELAATLLARHGRSHPGMRLLLYLGQKRGEQIEGQQKQSVEASGVGVLSVTEEGGAATDILEGLQFLRQGGLVSLTGDRLWGAGQRAVTVRFAGAKARIPEIPYVLAMTSGAPLLFFFGVRLPGGEHRFVVHPPLFITPAGRGERGGAIEAAAQAYADKLADTVRAHPDQWFHFEPFLEETAGDTPSR